jgi:GNAT superfamily N-acetyltransferase
MQPITIKHEGYTITTDKHLLKPEQIHAWLSTEAYWSKNIPFSLVKQAFDHSFCIGILYNDEQIGYARLVTDYASFGYLADVYVIEEHRGKGLSKKMLSVIMELDWVKGLRRIMLATLDAHELYRQMGFVGTAFPERFMEINRPAIYEDTATSLS